MPAATRLDTVAGRLAKLQRELIRQAAARFDVIARESAARALGGTATMHMHTRGGKRPAVRFYTKATIRKTAGTSYAIVRGLPKGPWVWIEVGTAEHDVGIARNGRRPRMKYGDEYRTGPIRHLGARGKLAWTRAENTFQAEYPDIALRMLKETVRRG